MNPNNLNLKTNSTDLSLHTLGYLQISCCHISGFDLRKFVLCLLWFMQFFYCREWRPTKRNLCNLLLLLFLLSSMSPYIGQNFLRTRSKVKRTFHFLIQIRFCAFNCFNCFNCFNYYLKAKPFWMRFFHFPPSCNTLMVKNKKCARVYIFFSTCTLYECICTICNFYLLNFSSKISFIFTILSQNLIAVDCLDCDCDK